MTTKAKSISKVSDGGGRIVPPKPEEAESGQVFFVKTTKGIFPLSHIQKGERLSKKEENKRRSKQRKQEAWLRDQGLVQHPLSVSGLLYLQENSIYFDACVRQIAVDVVGQGWDVKIKEGKKHDEKLRQQIVDFLMDPNDTDEDISDIIKKAVIDWGTIGWWALEVGRDDPPDGEVTGLWHIPAHTIWRHKDKLRFVQIRNDKRVWFAKFNEGLAISSKTGEETGNEEEMAHEIIFQAEYYQKSDYYGRPNILPAVSAAVGLIGARDYNLAFFENYGIPTAMIILEGRWSSEAARQIVNFLDVEVKGSANAHKTIVLKPPAEGKVTHIPMMQEAKEASFKGYYKMMRDEILAAYKMPPYRIGIAEQGSLGGSTAAEHTKIYASSIIQPLKNKTAKTITKLIQKGLGQDIYYFEWGKLDTRDMDAYVKRLQLEFMMGAMSPNDVRRELGKEPRQDPAGDQYYVAANYVPVGEENVEKREQLAVSALENLAAKVEEAIAKGNLPEVIGNKEEEG